MNLKFIENGCDTVKLHDEDFEHFVSTPMWVLDSQSHIASVSVNLFVKVQQTTQVFKKIY